MYLNVIKIINSYKCIFNKYTYTYSENKKLFVLFVLSPFLFTYRLLQLFPEIMSGNVC